MELLKKARWHETQKLVQRFGAKSVTGQAVVLEESMNPSICFRPKRVTNCLNQLSHSVAMSWNTHVSLIIMQLDPLNYVFFFFRTKLAFSILTP